MPPTHRWVVRLAQQSARASSPVDAARRGASSGSFNEGTVTLSTATTFMLPFCVTRKIVAVR